MTDQDTYALTAQIAALTTEPPLSAETLTTSTPVFGATPALNIEKKEKWKRDNAKGKIIIQLTNYEVKDTKSLDEAWIDLKRIRAKVVQVSPTTAAAFSHEELFQILFRGLPSAYSGNRTQHLFSKCPFRQGALAALMQAGFTLPSPPFTPFTLSSGNFT